MNSGPGATGWTRITRGGGGGPIRIPMLTCPNASVAPSKKKLNMNFFTIFLLCLMLHLEDHPADEPGSVNPTVSVIAGGILVKSLQTHA